MGELKRANKLAAGTCLLSAVRQNSIELMKALLEDKDETRTDDNGASLLMIALSTGSVEAVKLLLSSEAIKDQDEDSNNVLHYALQSSNVKEMTEMLASFISSSDIEMKDLLSAKNKTDKNTPIHTLAKQDNADPSHIFGCLPDKELFLFRDLQMKTMCPV